MGARGHVLYVMPDANTLVVKSFIQLAHARPANNIVYGAACSGVFGSEETYLSTTGYVARWCCPFCAPFMLLMRCDSAVPHCAACEVACPWTGVCVLQLALSLSPLAVLFTMQGSLHD